MSFGNHSRDPCRWCNIGRPPLAASWGKRPAHCWSNAGRALNVLRPNHTSGTLGTAHHANGPLGAHPHHAEGASAAYSQRVQACRRRCGSRQRQEDALGSVPPSEPSELRAAMCRGFAGQGQEHGHEQKPPTPRGLANTHHHPALEWNRSIQKKCVRLGTAALQSCVRLCAANQGGRLRPTAAAGVLAQTHAVRPTALNGRRLSSNRHRLGVNRRRLSESCDRQLQAVPSGKQQKEMSRP